MIKASRDCKCFLCHIKYLFPYCHLHVTILALIFGSPPPFVSLFQSYHHIWTLGHHIIHIFPYALLFHFVMMQSHLDPFTMTSFKFFCVQFCSLLSHSNLNSFYHGLSVNLITMTLATFACVCVCVKLWTFFNDIIRIPICWRLQRLLLLWYGMYKMCTH